MTVMLHAGSPVVRCILDIDNQATDHRLRARLPTGSSAPSIVGTHFGEETRLPGVRPETGVPLEAPTRTAPAHRYVAVRADTGGLVVLAPGFFEYEHTPHGDLLITLLRSVGSLSRGDLPGRPGHAAWPTRTPGAQCLGRTRIELAIAPVAPEDVLQDLWESVFAAPRGMWIRDAIGLSVPSGGVTLEGARLVFSTLKPPARRGEEGMVLRCINPDARRAAGAWRFAEPVRAAHRTRLDEQEPVPLVLEEHGRVVRFTVEPYETATVFVR
jgi:alpha-mannosidase